MLTREKIAEIVLVRLYSGEVLEHVESLEVRRLALLGFAVEAHHAEGTIGSTYRELIHGAIDAHGVPRERDGTPLPPWQRVGEIPVRDERAERIGRAVRRALPTLDDEMSARDLAGTARFLERHADTEGGVWVLDAVAEALREESER